MVFSSHPYPDFASEITGIRELAKTDKALALSKLAGLEELAQQQYFQVQNSCTIGEYDSAMDQERAIGEEIEALRRELESQG